MVFDSTELFCRGVTERKLQPNLWHNDGTISSAAFKSSNGVSVIRKASQSISDIASRIKSIIDKDYVFAVSYEEILLVDVFIEEKPSTLSKYHCNLWGNSSKKDISNHQARFLAKNAKLVYPDIQYPIATITF